jgi:hypothetical protein
LVNHIPKPLAIKTAWLSRLAVPDSVIFDSSIGLKSAKMVLEATEYGVITWPIIPRVAEGQRSYKFDIGPDAKEEFLHISDLKNWMCQPIDMVPPALCKEIGPDGLPCGIRAVLTSTTAVGYLRFSAKHCFPCMRLHELQEMIKLFEIPVATLPSTKGEATHVCLKYVLPMADDKEIADIMELGNASTKRLPFHSVLTQEGIETLVDEVLPHDAKAEIVGAAKDYKKYVEAVRTAAVAKAKPKAKAAAKKKKKCGEKDLLVCELGRKYLPEAVDCGLTNETEWHTRFKATYPALAPPFQTSMCYEEGCNVSKRAAMLFCVQWCWTEHTRKTEEECPWDLS